MSDTTKRLFHCVTCYFALAVNQFRAGMFISSMANKNRMDKDDGRLLPRNNTFRHSPRNKFVLEGQTTPLKIKPREYRTNTARTIRPAYAELPHPPRASVEPVEDPESTANKREIQLDSEENDLHLNLEELKDDIDASSTYWNKGLESSRSARIEENSWFLDPVHRSDEFSVPLSELSKTNPLTASVLKARSEGTLERDYHEDIGETPIDDFDFELFRKTDDELIRRSMRKESGLQSPYQMELARLRREKLKLEETYLLKMRCEAELERTRGPKPKWYEMKTKQFCIEAQKNNELLANRNDWQELLDYRNTVLEASGQWSNLRK